MRSIYQRLVLVAAFLLLVACEPIGPMPGKALSGEVTASPDNWDDLNRFEVVQLETTGPYSINLWGLGLGPNFYVASSKGPGSNWATRIAKDPLVRLRINGKVYELKAQMVDDESELEAVTIGFKQKYDLDAREDFPEAVVYRLVSRNPG